MPRRLLQRLVRPLRRSQHAIWLRHLDEDPALVPTVAQIPLLDLRVLAEDVVQVRVQHFAAGSDAEKEQRHIARLEELRELGVDQFAIYLQHDGKDQTLQAYGERILPRMAETRLAKS